MKAKATIVAVIAPSLRATTWRLIDLYGGKAAAQIAVKRHKGRCVAKLRRIEQ